MTDISSQLSESKLNVQQYPFWMLQLIGWGGYVFFLSLSRISWPEQKLVHAGYIPVATITGLLITLFLRRFFKVIWNKPLIYRCVSTIAGVGVASLLWTISKDYLHTVLHSRYELNSLWCKLVYWYPSSFFILVSWTGLYYGIKYYQTIQTERENHLKLVSLSQQAELKMLRYQINPHFLFNSLNSVSTLIMEGHNKTANRMLIELSKFLRVSLDTPPDLKAPLGREIETLKLYLNIEKIRFENRLDIKIDIQKTAENALIPNLILQPLIENCIKHACSSTELTVTIHLKAYTANNKLSLELSDNGPGAELIDGQPSNDSGVGVANTRDRLKAYYGNNYTLLFSPLDPLGLKITIQIPLEYSDE